MIVKEKETLDDSKNFIKVAVDIEKNILAQGCELHVDCMEELFTSGSLPEHIWGASIYPGDKTIDFVSLINIRPAQGNRSMEIEDPALKKRVENIIKMLLF